MIVHESINGLLADVLVLKARCDTLEAANTNLRESMNAIEHAFGAQTALSNGNLTGYASFQSSQGISHAGLYQVIVN